VAGDEVAPVKSQAEVYLTSKYFKILQFIQHFHISVYNSFIEICPVWHIWHTTGTQIFNSFQLKIYRRKAYPILRLFGGNLGGNKKEALSQCL
jgi:hypothetical protein